MICSDDPHFALRHELVQFARTKGIKAAARTSVASATPSANGFRRFQDQGNPGLLRSQSRAPIPAPIKPTVPGNQSASPCASKSPGFGARRLIAEFDLQLGHNACPTHH